jgi:protein-S-isoprenylcysteine O-methyltransferase Ste14
MFEVVIMVSPFAFYFYTAYGPSLQWLNHSQVTAWLTGFLLPHAVISTSPLLEFLRWNLGRYAFGFGLLAFFALAAQIYGSKLLGRKMVASGIYRYVRHPQYLCLGISAFGLFTAWPRMIIFLLFVCMLFTYYLLARVEEQRMLAVDPHYADYMRSTGMFLPGNPGRRLFLALFGSMADSDGARCVAVMGLLLIILLSGFGLHAYTLRHLSSTELSPNLRLISVYPMSAEQMRASVSLALSDPSLQRALQQETKATLVAHILPTNYGMIGMFADIGSRHMERGTVRLSDFRGFGGWLLPFLEPEIRTDLMGSEGEQHRVVFSRVDDPSGQPVSPAQVFDLSAKMTPVYVVDVDAGAHTVNKVINPPPRSFWGNVKMPIF